MKSKPIIIVYYSEVQTSYVLNYDFIYNITIFIDLAAKGKQLLFRDSYI